MTPRALVLAIVMLSSRAHAESCAITSVTGVAFGAYDVFAASPVVAAGSVTYVCTGVQATDRISIEIALAPDGTAARAMLSAGHALLYQLYLDAARTIVWGTGAAGTSVYGPAAPPNGAATAVPIYGRIPARQDVAAGAYADSIVVTLQL